MFPITRLHDVISTWRVISKLMMSDEQTLTAQQLRSGQRVSDQHWTPMLTQVLFGCLQFGDTRTTPESTFTRPDEYQKTTMSSGRIARSTGETPQWSDRGNTKGTSGRDGRQQLEQSKHVYGASEGECASQGAEGSEPRSVRSATLREAQGVKLQEKRVRRARVAEVSCRECAEKRK